MQASSFLKLDFSSKLLSSVLVHIPGNLLSFRQALKSLLRLIGLTGLIGRKGLKGLIGFMGLVRFRVPPGCRSLLANRKKGVRCL